MIENERHRQIMEYLNRQDEPVTCKQIHQACDLLTDTDDAAKVLFYLRSIKRWVKMIGKDPRKYQITTAGIAALNEDANESVSEGHAQEQAPEENGKPNQTTIKQQSNKLSLAASLDELIVNRLPINYEPDELVLMASTLRDVYDVLEVRLPDHEDLEDFRKKAIDLIETLRQQMEEPA